MVHRVRLLESRPGTYRVQPDSQMQKHFGTTVPCYVSHTLEASAMQKNRDTQHMALTLTVPVPNDNGAPDGVSSAI